MSTTELLLLGGLLLNGVATAVVVARANASTQARLARIETLVELVVNKRIKTPSEPSQSPDLFAAERPLY